MPTPDEYRMAEQSIRGAQSVTPDHLWPMVEHAAEYLDAAADLAERVERVKWCLSDVGLLPYQRVEGALAALTGEDDDADR